jgi:pimeloyl-ACP methyl ester carboxylesterase
MNHSVKPTGHESSAMGGRLLLILAAISMPFSAGAASARDQPHGIHEQRYVSVGGIDQWITIRGQDRNNPVVLFLHGGPGDALSPFAEQMFGLRWQQEFTLVQWDQRGAGRTYGKNGASVEPTLTIERMVQDGEALSSYLLSYLHQTKMALAGSSWGSVLGIEMVKARPELFCAYIGSSQVVNVREEQAATYERVLALARAADDSQAVGDLMRVGPPPWDSLRKLVPLLRWARTYEEKSAPSVVIHPALEYASAQDRSEYAAGEEMSFVHFMGPTLSGPMMGFDIKALGTDFAVPVFIIQGQHDLRTLPDVTKSWFDTIRARKEFVLVAHSAHGASQASQAALLKVLTKQVRPLCSASEIAQ